MRTKHAMNHIIWQTKLRNNFYYISVTCAQRTHRKSEPYTQWDMDKYARAWAWWGVETPKAQRNTTDNKNPKRGKVFLWTLSWLLALHGDSRRFDTWSQLTALWGTALAPRIWFLQLSRRGFACAQHGNVFIEIETQKKATNKREWAV